jgi:hypothetical protein
MPVLVRSGTIESRDVAWLVDPHTRDYMIGPLLYYQIRGNVIPLPWDLHSQPERDYMERVVSEHLLNVDRFVLIARVFGDNGNFAAWLRGRVGPLGFCSRSSGDFGQVEALMFDRNPGTCTAER